MNTTGKYVPRNSNQTNAFSNNSNRMNGTSSSSAFGNKDNEYRQARRREAEAEAYRAEAERQRLKAEAAAAKKKLEDGMNYTSEEFYPSLGSTSTKKTQTQTQPVLNYKQKMVEAEEQRKLLITTAPEEEEEDENLLITIKMRNQQIMRNILNRPSVVHSDYYDEEQYERDDIINIDYTENNDDGSVVSEETIEEEADELNTHVIAERRSGDKSLW
jgi:hypothetical protein